MALDSETDAGNAAQISVTGTGNQQTRKATMGPEIAKEPTPGLRALLLLFFIGPLNIKIRNSID